MSLENSSTCSWPWQIYLLWFEQQHYFLGFSSFDSCHSNDLVVTICWIYKEVLVHYLLVNCFSRLTDRENSENWWFFRQERETKAMVTIVGIANISGDRKWQTKIFCFNVTVITIWLTSRRYLLVISPPASSTTNRLAFTNRPVIQAILCMTRCINI